MNKIFNKLFLGLAVCGLAMTACSDDTDWNPGAPADGQGVFFPSTQANNVLLTETAGSFEVTVYRSTSQGAATVQLTSTPGENASGIFSVPSEVSFADGEATAKFSVAYKDLEYDVEYALTISAVDSTPYGITDLELKVACPLVWEVVSTNATLIDNMFEAFGVSGVEIAEITVEKHPAQNKYRFKSPYDNSYFEMLFGVEGVLPDGFEVPYIELDGESYLGSYYVPAVKLGWVMVNGEGPTADADWKGFGSLYGNASEDLAKYPLGTYDETNKVFDLGALFFNFDNDGSYVYPLSSKTLLYLNN